MRKILFTLALILPFVFNSCSSDDDVDKLDGTTWEYIGDYSVETLEFAKDQVKYTFLETGSEEYTPETYTGTYTYDPPKLSITIMGETIEGTVSSNKFTSIGANGDTYVFVKK
jgi:hypothetical protein